MVYRDLTAEEAQKRFTALSEAPEEASEAGKVGVKVIGHIHRKANKELVKQLMPKKPKRKVVKALVPK